ncbi:MAG TPA: ATP:cob(I)alamin adenosyltransferase, partial [Candidatus Nanoarchaeia archaeon]|nr:ATP:cob(I)alamin adenosyltransferase [Candidatus Nanoarchaeia archaeon]
VLLQVQHDLFTVGAELSALGTKKLEIELPAITSEHVDFLDEALKATETVLPSQKRFILPNGTPGAAHLHMARTICRRAERRVSACDKLNPNPEVMKYLNRLSDLLFLFARAENQGKVKEEYVKYHEK